MDGARFRPAQPLMSHPAPSELHERERERERERESRKYHTSILRVYEYDYVGGKATAGNNLREMEKKTWLCFLLIWVLLDVNFRSLCKVPCRTNLLRCFLCCTFTEVYVHRVI